MSGPSYISKHVINCCGGKHRTSHSRLLDAFQFTLTDLYLHLGRTVKNSSRLSEIALWWVYCAKVFRRLLLKKCICTEIIHNYKVTFKSQKADEFFQNAATLTFEITSTLQTGDPGSIAVRTPTYLLS